MAAHFDTSAASMSLPLRRLLIDCEEPSAVPLFQVRDALGLPRHPGYPELRSLALLRLARGLPPEVMALNATSAEVMHVPRVITSAACAALRAAIDCGQSCSPDSVDQLADHQLDLSLVTLGAIVGRDTVENLVKLGRQWQLQVRPEDARHEGDVAVIEIFGRRYCAEGRPWMPFHGDRAAVTVNVALSDERDHEGGRLLAALDGVMQHIPRMEGQATVHGATLLHGVTRMTSGSRHSLILFMK